MDLLIHGVYDATTLKSLQSLNVTRIGFDLRGSSLNLVPFHVLKTLIADFRLRHAYLTFENDKIETVNSFLDLLGEEKHRFHLEFRDAQNASYYASIGHPFTWFFDPSADWKKIIALPHLAALVLPLKYKDFFQSLPQLWQSIDDKKIPVILHVSSFADLELYVQEKNLTISVDLGREMETGYRKIDQLRLINLSIWRPTYEIASGQ
jgi:hypothetical protein